MQDFSDHRTHRQMNTPNGSQTHTITSHWWTMRTITLAYFVHNRTLPVWSTDNSNRVFLWLSKVLSNRIYIRTTIRTTTTINLIKVISITLCHRRSSTRKKLISVVTAAQLESIRKIWQSFRFCSLPTSRSWRCAAVAVVVIHVITALDERSAYTRKANSKLILFPIY